MDEFLLIMRHEDGSKIASPEQMQAWMKQTMDWISTIAAQNKFVGGTGLPMQDACVVKSNKMVTNGPFGDGGSSRVCHGMPCATRGRKFS